MDFKNKVVWVTGASSGIGKALVKLLDKKGAHIILSARNEEKLQSIYSELSSNNHLVVPLDLSDSSNFQKLANDISNKYGRIDVLINNGGISQRGNASDTTIEVDRKIMEVNYFGNVALTKAVLPYFQSQKSGTFVIISSIAGKFGFFLRSSYSASKHALHGFYESLRLEEEDNGISVTIACPGKINTDISVNAMNGKGESHGEMDHNQATGMSAEKCSELLLRGVEREKREILIGNKEIKAVTLKRFFPNLFYKVIRKQSAT